MTENERKIWAPYKIEEFEFEGRCANIIFPEKANEKKSWTLKMEYRDAFPETEIELLKRGYHVAFLKNTSRWAPKVDCDAKAKFVKFVSEKYSLADKCIPIGMSAGGAHAVNFAGFYPECVQCMFIDAPVLNFASHPMRCDSEYKRKVWENEFTKAYPGITRADVLGSFDNHPINKAQILIENKIPILMLYGTDDTVVNYCENGLLLEELYADHPELLTVIQRVMQGHHPHAFPDRPHITADWIEEHA